MPVHRDGAVNFLAENLVEIESQIAHDAFHLLDGLALLADNRVVAYAAVQGFQRLVQLDFGAVGPFVAVKPLVEIKRRHFGKCNVRVKLAVGVKIGGVQPVDKLPRIIHAQLAEAEQGAVQVNISGDRKKPA